jgi:hypothetical protein
LVGHKSGYCKNSMDGVKRLLLFFLYDHGLPLRNGEVGEVCWMEDCELVLANHPERDL